MSGYYQMLLNQVVIAVCNSAAVRAMAAHAEIKAMCERDRRSLGQKFRWMK